MCSLNNNLEEEGNQGEDGHESNGEGGGGGAGDDTSLNAGSRGGDLATSELDINANAESSIASTSAALGGQGGSGAGERDSRVNGESDSGEGSNVATVGDPLALVVLASASSSIEEISGDTVSLVTDQGTEGVLSVGSSSSNGGTVAGVEVAVRGKVGGGVAG